MSASKAPAYFGLVVAVAAGVLMAGTNKRTSPDKAPVIAFASAPNASVGSGNESKVAPAVPWKTQNLTFGSLKFRSMLPSSNQRASCAMPGAFDEEVGVCRSSINGDDGSSWQVRVVTQRDRFVPAPWFDHALQALRALQPDAVARRLGVQANEDTQAGLTSVELLSPPQLPDSLAIQGAASDGSPASSGMSQSCVYAFFLVANRPATLLYCATTEEASLSGAQKIVSSLSSLNPSREFKPGSAQAAEHAYYLRRVRDAGGAIVASDLASSERAYEQSAADECGKYPLISQERFQCFEAQAANRLSSQ